MEIHSAVRVFTACAVVGAILYGFRAVALALGRSQTRPGGRIVAVLETTVLPNAALHVVRVAERYYLVGCGAAHPATLCELPAESIPVSHAAAEPALGAGGRFVRRIARLRARSSPASRG